MGSAETKVISNGLKKYFSPMVIIQIVAWMVLAVFFVSGMNNHVQDENVHMTYEKKVEAFVTRPEFDLNKDNFLEELKGIHSEIQSLNEYLRNGK